MLTNNSCPHCHVIFETVPKLLGHVAAHILHDSSINREDEPCGLCLLLVPLCWIVLKKYKNSFTVDYTNSTCQRLVKFSYAAASQPSASNPCANVLVRCPRCPKGSNTVWKYNMAFHYIKKHSPSVPPREFDILDFELEGLKVVWNSCHATNRVETKQRKYLTTKLNISAAHSSCICLQYVLHSSFFHDGLSDSRCTLFTCSDTDLEAEPSSIDTRALAESTGSFSNIDDMSDTDLNVSNLMHPPSWPSSPPPLPPPSASAALETYASGRPMHLAPKWPMGIYTCCTTKVTWTKFKMIPQFSSVVEGDMSYPYIPNL